MIYGIKPLFEDILISPLTIPSMIIYKLIFSDMIGICMIKKVIPLLLLFVSLLGLSNVYAHTSSMDNFVCPIGGEEFSQLMDSSGTSFGQRLDLKPIGPIAAPWSLPVCPSNKFVMFKKDFTDDEIKILTTYIESPEYQKIINESTYYRAAQFKRLIHTPTDNVAFTLLKATWQSPKPAYLNEALAEFKKYIQQLEDGKSEVEFTNDPSWINAELIVLELERRTEQFEKAEQHTKELSELKLFNDDNKTYKKILERQRTLINQKDKNPHRI